jgi:hypothetical protein
MKPSIQIITVSTIFVGTIAVLGVAIERQRAPLTPDLLSGAPIPVKPGAATLCVARPFVDPHELRLAVTHGEPLAGKRIDLAAFSTDLSGFTPKQYETDIAVQGRYQSSPDWVRLTILSDALPATTPDLEPVCGPARCSVRAHLPPNGVRFEYTFPKTLMPDWSKLHANALKRVGEWAADTSCRR